MTHTTRRSTRNEHKPKTSDYKNDGDGAKIAALEEMGQPTGHVLYTLCSDCGLYPADDPSPLCPGCEAYREHTAVY